MPYPEMPNGRADSLIMTIAVQANLAPAGWYPDPAGSGLLRWWDGALWTAQLQSPPPTAGYGQHRYPKPTAY
jgi:hypothetical protein